MNALASFVRRPCLMLPVALCCAFLAGCGDNDNPTAPGGGDPGDTGDWIAMSASQDTYIDGDNADQNYGQNNLLRIGPDMHALLQFDMQALPQDAVITAMRLRLTQSADAEAADAASVSVTWMPSDSWDEDTVTADEAPNQGSEGLGTLSLAALSSGHRSVVFASTPSREKAHYEQLYLNRILGVRLSSGQRVDVLSGESSDAAKRPTLEVTYVEGTRVVLTPIEDAWTSASEPDANYQDMDYLAVRAVSRNAASAFVKFDLSSLPAGARLEMARFAMMAFDGYAWGGDGRVYTHLVADDSWSAATITANNEPSVVGEHLGYWWLWYNRTPRDAWGVNVLGLLRPVAQAEAEGDQVLSLRVNSPGYDTEYYRSTEADAMKRPKLEIVYTR